jgi:predicted secreted protein
MGKSFKYISAPVINTNSIFLLLIMTLSGCQGHRNTASSSVVKDPENPAQAAEVRIACQPNIQIKKNDTLVVEFTEYPGRAYSWEMAAPDSSLVNLKLMKILRHSLSNKADPAAKAEFYFLGFSTGEETLIFRYFRPWEKNKPAADSCIIKVKIR